MSLNLVGFVKRLLPSFSKSDVEADMEISLEYLPVIIEGYSSLESVIKTAKLQNKQTKDLLDTFYKEIETGSKLKLGRTKSIGADTVTLMTNAKLNGEYILKEISDSVNDVVMSQALTAYKINLLRVVPHFYFMTRFATDLLNFIYLKETEHAKIETERGFKLNKKQEEFIVKNLWIYAKIVGFYGCDHDEFKKQIDSLSEVTIPQTNVDEIVAQFSGEKLDVFNTLPNGFIGSPIYSIRLVFAQWEADRYRTLKDKKKLLELRLLHLKLVKEQGTTDSSIEKEITHLQKTITDHDYKLSKIEDSLDE